jgi:hypothetical protein
VVWSATIEPAQSNVNQREIATHHENPVFSKLLGLVKITRMAALHGGQSLISQQFRFGNRGAIEKAT